MRRDVQSLRDRLGLVVAVWLLGVGVAAFWYHREPWPSPTHPAIRATAIVFVMYWAFASALMLRMTREQWTQRSDERILLQGCWLAGWLMLCVHVAVAFGLAHGWSHAAAFEHTKRTAGVGEGIFVNYAFVLLWGLDVLWLLLHPVSYARRPRWVGWPLHGFLAFVTFNATVIYGTLLARLLGGVVFMLLAGVFVIRLRRG